MAHSLKCPICGHTGIKVSNDTAACQLCGHNGAMQPFQPKNNEEHATRDGRLIHMPPQQVLDAVRVVQDHFSARGVRKWAFDGIQSRVAAEELPMTTLPKIANMAAAFGCDLIIAATPVRIVEIATKLANDRGPGWAFMDEDERLEAVATVKYIIDGFKGR